MALRLTQLDLTNRPAFEELLAQAWEQNWGSELGRALIRWRYYDRPSGGGTWLAFNDGQCVAMLDSFVRPYLLEGRRILVREGADWYCLPKYRPLGLGVRLIRQLMASPEPMLAISGRETTRALMPRLGWTRLPDVQNYVLPVKVRGVASSMLRKRWPHREAYARAIPGMVPLRPPRRAPAPPGRIGRIANWRLARPTGLPDPQHQALVQLLDQAEQEWFARMPSAVAQPLGLVFYLDDTPIAFSLSQIEPTQTGFESRILHLQIADPAQAVVDWVVAETSLHLVARGAGIIRCWASSPEKVAALRRVGFVALEPLPCY